MWIGPHWSSANMQPSGVSPVNALILSGWPRAYGPRWPCFPQKMEKKEKTRETKTMFISQKISWKLPVSAVHWLEHMRSTCPHPSGRRTRNCFLCSCKPLGHWGREMGTNVEIKVNQSCHWEEESKEKKISKLRKFCPILLRLSINIKAYRKLKLLCDTYMYTVNRNIYLCITSWEKNIKAFLIVR